MISEKSKSILRGISLHRKSQELHNKGFYEEARKEKIISNRILMRYSDEDVAAHFSLFKKKKK